jgi:hypothetical protein
MVAAVIAAVVIPLLGRFGAGARHAMPSERDRPHNRPLTTSGHPQRG